MNMDNDYDPFGLRHTPHWTTWTILHSDLIPQLLNQSPTQLLISKVREQLSQFTVPVVSGRGPDDSNKAILMDPVIRHATNFNLVQVEIIDDQAYEDDNHRLQQYCTINVHSFLDCQNKEGDWAMILCDDIIPILIPRLREFPNSWLGIYGGIKNNDTLQITLNSVPEEIPCRIVHILPQTVHKSDHDFDCPNLISLYNTRSYSQSRGNKMVTVFETSPKIRLSTARNNKVHIPTRTNLLQPAELQVNHPIVFASSSSHFTSDSNLPQAQAEPSNSFILRRRKDNNEKHNCELDSPPQTVENQRIGTTNNQRSRRQPSIPSAAMTPYDYHTLSELKDQLALAVQNRGIYSLLKRNVYGIVVSVSSPKSPGSYNFEITDETMKNVPVRIHTWRYSPQLGPEIRLRDIIRIHRATVQNEAIDDVKQMVLSTSPHHNYTLFNYIPNDPTAEIEKQGLAKTNTFTEADQKRILELRTFIDQNL